MVFRSVFKVGFPSGISNSAGGMSSAVSNLGVVDKYFQLRKNLDRGSKHRAIFRCSNQWIFLIIWSSPIS